MPIFTQTPVFNKATVGAICGSSFLFNSFQGSVGRPNFMDDSFAFLQAVLGYRRNATFAEARRIYGEFIKMRSPQEVNVASASQNLQRRQIEVYMENTTAFPAQQRGNPELFDGVYDQVMTLVLNAYAQQAPLKKAANKFLEDNKRQIRV